MNSQTVTPKPSRPGLVRKPTLLTLPAALLMAASATSMARPPGNEGNPRILPPPTHPHGMSCGEWAGAWWNWALQFPYKSDPITDDTGEDAANGQSGPVWFLAGTVHRLYAQPEPVELELKSYC